MARRHTTGFSIVGFDTDPTPGDPDVIINEIVRTYTAVGDDAAAAFGALKGDAMTSGTGKAMDGLRTVIGDKYPPKLQKTAESFHSAADAYRTYAGALADAQSQLDRAMDQAEPVAALAATTVATPPTDATPEQRDSARQQQDKVDEAAATLSAAKRLAQDAKDLRDRAAGTFDSTLRGVSTVPERGFFKKIADFFARNPFIKLLISIAVALVALVFPVLGLALGALTLAVFTALDTIEKGEFGVGAFLVGLLGLAAGGLSVLAKTVPALAKVNSAIADKGKKFFTQLPGPISNGIKGSTDALRNSPALANAAKFAGHFGADVGANAAANAIDGKPNDPLNLLIGAGLGAGVGAAGAGLKGGRRGRSGGIGSGDRGAPDGGDVGLPFKPAPGAAPGGSRSLPGDEPPVPPAANADPRGPRDTTPPPVSPGPAPATPTPTSTPDGSITPPPAGGGSGTAPPPAGGGSGTAPTGPVGPQPPVVPGNGAPLQVQPPVILGNGAPLQVQPPANGVPPLTFHGTSIDPNIAFSQGLRPPAVQNGQVPNYDLFHHMHNSGPDGGFVSTTGNPLVPYQFLRPDPGRPPVIANGTTFPYREGYIYNIRPEGNPVHVPSQNLPADLDRFRYQDEYAFPGVIPPSQIESVSRVNGHFAFENDGRGGLRLNVPPGGGRVSTQTFPSHVFRPPSPT